ncbi:hypothetical protein NVP1231O_12 [Vibrio phage 1.231.O._10N.261.49.F8]|nr:hypothetical protein NVP1119O_12 [Vibrio phage 1.119.O._10N.261.51.A9]AUR90384.1 hypothetical protein NVP1143O_12 [Vibrio phage 1.143.O._10N.261.55.C8]AUR96670.1 hypothetical protein NVP1231O_12 [Vibrio phage 1.231.O._10N.261.49.F8]
MIKEVSVEKCGDAEYGFCFGEWWHVEYKRLEKVVKWKFVGKVPSRRIAKTSIKGLL